MTGYLLDTNMVRYWYNQNAVVVAKVDSLPADDLIKVSAITLGEIEFGHCLTVTTDPSKREAYAAWINVEFPSARVLSVTRKTRVQYGDLKAKLFKMFPPKSEKENHPECCLDQITGKELGIDENDLWIASQAIESNMILVTNDKMLRIKDVAGPLLTVEDWTKP